MTERMESLKRPFPRLDTPDLEAIKDNDRIWIGWGDFPHAEGLRTVCKVSPTQIVTDYNGDGRYLVRFRRETGYRVGGSMMGDCISSVATRREAAEWDEYRKRNGEAERLRLLKQERRRLLGAELASLIGYGCPVVEIHDKSVTLTISEITEAEVRSIARKLELPEVKP